MEKIRPAGFPSGGGLYNPVYKKIRDSQMTPSKAWEILSRAPSVATGTHHICGSSTHQSAVQRSTISGDCGTLVAEQNATGGLTTQSGDFSSSISRAYAALAKSRAGRRLGGLTMPGHSSSDGSSNSDDSSSSDEQRSQRAARNISQERQTNCHNVLHAEQEKGPQKDPQKSLEKARRQRMKRRERKSFRRQCEAIREKESRGEEAYEIVQGRHFDPSI